VMKFAKPKFGAPVLKNTTGMSPAWFGCTAAAGL